VATRQRREKLIAAVEKLLAHPMTVPKLKEAAQNWLDNKDDGKASGRAAAEAFIECLERNVNTIDETIEFLEGAGEKYAEMLGHMQTAKAAGEKYCTCDACALGVEIYNARDLLVKRSIWALGGDGWAYDIGYGGLDHVLASGENINVLVFDTEVYSNTGGQASKATPEAAIAKFAASGKRIKKKDLGLIAMSYGYVYVASVGMGADKNQFMKAVLEAEAYDGPSLIICYAPCINHGMRKGMGKTQENTKEAVESGYWNLYRFDPTKQEAGGNPFSLDSKDPKGSFRDYIMDQVRYRSLTMEFPDIAEELFEATETNAKERFEQYKKMAEA
jgi:pyruvate-ferredoxin/flavodoxin oxidoreductase